jgi:vacuolar-type H+-ATPase subunit I/STV1
MPSLAAEGGQTTPLPPRVFMLLPLFIALSVFLSSAPLPWANEMYRWTDEKGTVHFVDDLSKIPPEYLDRTRRIDAPESIPVQKETPPPAESKEDRVKKYLDEFDRKAEEKKKYERRVSELDEELELIEERLKEIEELEKVDYEYYIPFRDRRTGKFIAVATPYYDEKVRLTKRMEVITAEINSLEEKIAEIKRSF